MRQLLDEQERLRVEGITFALARAEQDYFQKHGRYLAIRRTPTAPPGRRRALLEVEGGLRELGWTTPRETSAQVEVEISADGRRARVISRVDWDGDGEVSELDLVLVEGILLENEL